MVSDKPVFIGIHGVWTTGDTSTDLMLRTLKAMGAETVEWDWGPRPPVLAKLLVDWYAAKLVRFVLGFYPMRPVVLIGHSFGSKIAVRAGRLMRLHRLWLFNAAVRADRDLSGAAKRVHVVANGRDPVLHLARRWLGWMGYGDLGRVGYQGPTAPEVLTWWEDYPDLHLHQQHGASLRWPHREIWANRILNDAVGGTPHE